METLSTAFIVLDTPTQLDAIDNSITTLCSTSLRLYLTTLQGGIY